MAKSNQQSTQPAAASSIASGEDRVASLARELFIKFAQPVTNRTPQWLAVEAFKLAKGFYEVADLPEPASLFDANDETDMVEQPTEELQEASA